MRNLLFALALGHTLALAACGDSSEQQSDVADSAGGDAADVLVLDEGGPDSEADAEIDASTDASTDAASPDAGGDAETDGESDASDICTIEWQTETLGDRTVRSTNLAPACTDPAIDSCQPGRGCMDDKQHVVLLPAPSDRRDLLWVHLGGSGGRPQGAGNIARVAATEGYHVIGLAYMNDDTVEDRCSDPETGLALPDTCEGEVRFEVIYGEDTSPHVAITPANSIVHRLERALAFLDAEDPSAEWGQYLDGDGHPRWALIAVSGFSQGGGMAGMISRDHSVARAVFFSKGAGAVLVRGDECASNDDCGDAALCCFGADCDGLGTGPGNCGSPGPAPWADTGAGGEGDASQRATPASRSYAIVHRDEFAYRYSPEVFALWGLDEYGDFLDADGVSEFGDTHLLSTGLTPCNGGGAHGSIGSDGAQPKVGGCDGAIPAMARAWRHMMTHVETR